jgi:hypothetical protein
VLARWLWVSARQGLHHLGVLSHADCTCHTHR